MSRQRSGRATKAKAAKSAKPRAARGARAKKAAPRGIYVQQARSDIYVLLLSVSLGAILLGSLLLLLVWGRYDYSTKATSIQTNVPEALAFAAPSEKSENFSI